jgi:hypothetical protein
MDKIYIKRYSEAFEKTVVKEYEAGGTIDALRQTNGIGEGSTILCSLILDSCSAVRI